MPRRSCCRCHRVTIRAQKRTFCALFFCTVFQNAKMHGVRQEDEIAAGIRNLKCRGSPEEPALRVSREVGTCEGRGGLGGRCLTNAPQGCGTYGMGGNPNGRNPAEK